MDKEEPKLDKYGRKLPSKQDGYICPNVAADAIVLRKHTGGIGHDILLITRAIEPFKGGYAFPGGHIDYNEDPKVACLRELKEECDIDGMTPTLVTVRGEPERDPRKHMITIVYHVEIDADKAKPKAGDDAATAQWYDLKKLKEDGMKFAFDHGSILDEFLEKFHPEYLA
jgi:8-oxo-dGTP diphosphatase